MTDDTIRNFAMAVNQTYELLNRELHFSLELINVGAEPGDCTGDTFREATRKVLKNARIIACWLGTLKK